MGYKGRDTKKSVKWGGMPKMEEVVKRNGDAKFQKEKIIEKFDL